MALVETIQSLCKQKQVTQKVLMEKCGLSNNAFTKWKNGSSPSIDIVCKIANYLDVSMDYLITGKEIEISLEDKQLLNDFHSLDKQFQELIKLNISKLKEIKIDNSI